MIQFKETSRELTKAEQYLLTLAPAIESISKIPDGTKIAVEAYAVYNSVNEETGETAEILAILTKDKDVYATCSKTFKHSFYDMVSIFGTEFTLEKITGTSKGGRTYVNCTLDITSV